MQMTETFSTYERSTTIMDIISKTVAVISLVTVIVTMVLGFVLGDGFSYFFFGTAAAVIVYAGAFALGIVVYKRGQNVALCRSYAHVLNHNPRNAVDEIYECLGTPKTVVMAAFIKLKNMGFLGNVIVDEEQMLVCLEPEAYDHEFICPVCGGKTMSNSDEDVCEFCGTIKEKEKN